MILGVMSVHWWRLPRQLAMESARCTRGYHNVRNIINKPLPTPGLPSGRELAKFMAAVQAAVYGSQESVLTPQIWQSVLQRKLYEHQERKAFRLGHHGTPGDEGPVPAKSS